MFTINTMEITITKPYMRYNRRENDLARNITITTDDGYSITVLIGVSYRDIGRIDTQWL